MTFKKNSLQSNVRFELYEGAKKALKTLFFKSLHLVACIHND